MPDIQLLHQAWCWLRNINTFSHLLGEGRCWGLFDKHYQYKYEIGRELGGVLLWRRDWKNYLAKTRQELLDEMDFPLVSIALAHDVRNIWRYPARMDSEIKQDLHRQFPGLYDERFFERELMWAKIADKLFERAEFPPRNMEHRVINVRRGRCIWRCGTVTRKDYQNRGRAKALFECLMGRMMIEGFRIMVVHSMHPYIEKIWSKEGFGWKVKVCSQYDFPNEEGENAHGCRWRTRFIPKQVLIELQPDDPEEKSESESEKGGKGRKKISASAAHTSF
ncbi:hypothetical protein QBC43DRAFT_304035 [Cladorrhinum sp. PSN259]|nr:hypothetical protein QBC43DRAFT_304035 [Cladorrhinum sp. PSN259]